MPFLISTALAAFSAEHPRWTPSAFATWLRDFGGTGVALDISLTEARLGEVVAAMRGGAVGLDAIEAPCPHPADFSRTTMRRGMLALCDPDSDRRRVALKHARATLERAAALGIPCVQLALGRAPGGVDESAIRAAIAEDGLADRATKNAVFETLENRGKIVVPAFDAVRRNLEALLADAEKLGLRLAILQAEDLVELPSFHELERLLAEFAGAPLGFWFDGPAAARLESLGLRPAMSWIEKVGAGLIGVTVHDGKWRTVSRIDQYGDEVEVMTGEWEAHLAPGEGIVAWDAIAAALATRKQAPAILLDVAHDRDWGLVREGLSPLRARGLWGAAR